MPFYTQMSLEFVRKTVAFRTSFSHFPSLFQAFVDHHVQQNAVLGGNEPFLEHLSVPKGKGEECLQVLQSAERRADRKSLEFPLWVPFSPLIRGYHSLLSRRFAYRGEHYLPLALAGRPFGLN